MRADLKEVKKLYDTWNTALDVYLICPDITELMDAFPVMLAELEAAREVIEKVREMEGYHGILYGLTFVRTATKRYDEVINAKD